MLLIREQEEPYNGQWVFPQGYVKAGETLKEAAKREVLEELGVEVNLEGLMGVYDDLSQEIHPSTHYVIVCYLGKLKGFSEPRPSAEAIDSAWVDASKGLPGVPSVVRRMLDDVELKVRGGRRVKW